MGASTDPTRSFDLNVHFLLQYSEETCVISRKGFGVETGKVSLGAKESVKIYRVSDQIGDDVHAEAGDSVHSSCSRVYMNNNYILVKNKGTGTGSITSQKTKTFA